MKPTRVSRMFVMGRRAPPAWRPKHQQLHSFMSTITDIDSTVQKLSREELNHFRAWFQEFDAETWDLQFEKDALAGKLDSLGEEALADENLKVLKADPRHPSIQFKKAGKLGLIPNQTTRKAGFTMVEVLVVVTILLIIAGFIARVVYGEKIREVDEWFVETFGFSHLWVTASVATLYVIHRVRVRKRNLPRARRLILPQD